MSLVRLRPVWMTNHPRSVLLHCWLGHQTCKNRRPYNLYCVGADVKPCSINLDIVVYPGTVLTYWGQIWWWWCWPLQLLEAAGHHFLSPVAVQLDNYLSSASTSVECLASCPHVMNAFIKANSTLPSPCSAAEEHLFSAAGQILYGSRCKLSNKHFYFLRNRLKNVNCE